MESHTGARGVSGLIRRQFISRYLILAASALVLVFLASALLIIADGLTDNIGAADVAVIPGNTVNSDGSPSERLRARLEKGIEMYRLKIVPRFIVSGGTGSEGVDEAMAMKIYLTDHGIPEESILVDTMGTTTWMTAKNVSEIMKINGWKSALVVTQYFHVTRSVLALRRFGVSTVFSVHANYFEWRDVYSVAREVAGNYSNRLKSLPAASPK